ncbi:hypothetical protein A3Q56_01902 [Intoshia linei]|uniref:Uncharacterized protein n=1 Tax=Intoshia linei TaxID=1819745 RepID=A0A177B7W5_9BILA|nr:hypothetical protein A3Q56_01902 [Intoshia linei]
MSIDELNTSCDNLTAAYRKDLEKNDLNELRNCLAQLRLNALSLMLIDNDISFDSIISDFSQKKKKINSNKLKLIRIDIFSSHDCLSAYIVKLNNNVIHQLYHLEKLEYSISFDYHSFHTNISITALQNITNVVVSIYHEMFQYLKNIDKLLTSLKDLTAFHESIESNDIATQEFNFKVPKKSFDKYMERFDCNVFPKLTLGDWLKVDEFEKVDENKSKSVVSINLNVGNSVKDLFNAIKSNSDLSFENSSNGVFDIKELNIQICFQIDNIKVYYENYYEIFPFIKFSIQLMDFEKFFSEDSEESIFLMSQFNEAFANYFSLHNNIISMYSQVFAECHTISQEMQNFQSKFLKLIHNNSSYSHEEYTMGIKSICKNMIEISHKVDKNIQMKNESHLKLTCFTIMYELLISRNKENPLQTKLNSILDSITCNEECTKPSKQKMRIKNAYLYYNSVYKDKKPTLQNLVKMLIKD